MPEPTTLPPPGRGQAQGPVRPTRMAGSVQSPAGARITGGLWAGRREVNGRVSLPEGLRRLEKAGNLQNLRVAAGLATGEFQGHHPFADSEVFKWLEAASWQLGSDHCPDLARTVEETVDLVVAAQRPDGYLNTWFQLARPGDRFRDLRWGHELYCAGHLIQAGIAHRRSTGATALFTAGCGFADLLVDVFGRDGTNDGFDGHPGVETALVELYRETGRRAYLDLAADLIDRRGQGRMSYEQYCLDRVEVRAAIEVEGHAVRQLYLLTGAADVAAENRDAELERACARLWHSMVGSKTYLTGGLGAHHKGETFGDPYELPNERAYCETCAAVAGVQWSWRMALLTGRARYSDLVERTLFNAVLAGVGLDGAGWLYSNPLQVRDGHVDTGGDRSTRRAEWFRCPCCPSNVMRLLASLEHYLASSDGDGLSVHQYVTGSYAGAVAGGSIVVRSVTAYPWSGRIELSVEETPPDLPWTLSLRIPHWAGGHVVAVNGQVVSVNDRVSGTTATDGWLRLRRPWVAGDRVVLELDLGARLVSADPRVDAARGCVAIERGPLVYCLEAIDQDGDTLDDVVLDPRVPLTEEPRPDLLGGIVLVRAAGRRRPPRQEDAALDGDGAWWPYRDADPDPHPENPAPPDAPEGRALTLTAVPYFGWANREVGAMRVWIPVS